MDMTDWQEKAKQLWQKAKKEGVAILKREYSPRGLAILFLLSLCVGVLTKSLLNDSLTIGHDDYTLARPEKITDLNLLEKSLIENPQTFADAPAVPKGESCAEEGK